jgi:hypothetical protein
MEHMDFLDPSKQRAHMIRLITGYVLIGVAILFATLILLYQAYGFGFGKDGEVIQNGLVFLSSAPSGADIYLNGSRYKNGTNTKLQLPAGQYNVELKRNGYQPWQRLVTVEGGGVEHFDYPRLIPQKLTTSPIKTYPEAPGFASASPDRHWLVVQQGAAPLNFDLYDLSDPKKISANLALLQVPESLITAPKSTTQGWKLVEWSTDNRHLLVQHSYGSDAAAGSSVEYIMLDIQTPADSVNLTKTLQLPTTAQLTLRDKKFDKYFVYDQAAHTLGTTAIGENGTITPLLEQVLAFKTYASDVVLYVTDHDPATGQPTPAGQVLSVLREGDQTYKIREHGAGQTYLVDLAKYSGDWFITAGSDTDGKVYVYQNPQRIRKASKTAALVPVQILRVPGPSFIQFSTNTQFVMIESGTSFSAYDAENDKRYGFVVKSAIDPPAAHATWMDGDRLMYVSDGKVQILDYDNINQRSLVPASSNYLPFFDRDYKYLYTLSPAPAGQSGMSLGATSLLTTADQ